MGYRKILIVFLTSALLLTSCWDKKAKESASDSSAVSETETSISSEVPDDDVSTEEKTASSKNSQDPSDPSSESEPSAEDSKSQKDPSQSTKSTVRKDDISPEEMDIGEEGDEEETSGKKSDVSSTKAPSETKGKGTKESTSVTNPTEDKKPATYTGDLLAPEDPYI